MIALNFYATVAQALSECGHKVIVNDVEYGYLPFWFKVVEINGLPNIVAIPFDDLPKSVKEVIESNRGYIYPPINDSDYGTYSYG